MQGTAKITGLKAAVKAMGAAFPKSPRKQVAILNASMRAAAKSTILPSAKRRAARGDGSGALAESLGIRATPKRKLASRAVGGVQITPVRYNPKAIALYANFYAGNIRGVVDGIRHGHLIEFGHATRNGGHVPAQPFLWPAAQSKASAYKGAFAKSMAKKTELAVRRAARKARIK